MKIDVIGSVDIQISKRTHETPLEINQYLKDCKGEYTIKVIAAELDMPHTQVAHYFRTDKSRAIPSPDIWVKLKEMLELDNRYDKEVLSFHEKMMVYEMTRRVHSIEGISPTLKAENESTILIGDNECKKLDTSTCSEESEDSTLDSKEPIKTKWLERELIKGDIAPTLRSQSHGNNPIIVLGASGQMTSTNTPAKSTKNIGQKPQKLQAILGESMKKTSPNTISFARAFLARPSLLPVQEKASKTRVARYSSRYVELRNITDLSCYYSKTLKDFSTMTEEELSARSSTPWKTWGIGGSTRFLTARISGSLRIGKECSLSDILELEVAPRYFLSQKTVQGLLKGLGKPQLLELSRLEDTVEECTRQ